MEYRSTQRCAFPPCTNSFPQLGLKKYCSDCCRVKDFNRRKRNQEKLSGTPAVNKDTKLSMMEPANLGTPSISFPQTEGAQVEVKKGMNLAGVGEAAIGTAGVLFLKHQLIDKENQNQLQYQMNQLLKQQAIISRQIQVISQKVDKLSKKEDTSSWGENLLI